MAPPDREPDSPGWQVRVVPNLFPAFEHQEVVVHTPRHVRSIAELTDDELAPIALTWHSRLAAAREAGFGHPQLLLNEGRDAGASLPHSHSQLVWLREPPPVSLVEARNLEKGNCALCRILGEESLEIALEASISLRSAVAPRMPYELLVAPLQHDPDPAEVELLAVLRLLRMALVRVRGLEGPVAVNAWLHAGAHWHLEVVPRLSQLAGLELGAGLYVNWLPPEEAAERMRG